MSEIKATKNFYDHGYHCSLFILLGKRAIRALAVKCDNMVRGCTWAGTVGTLEKHAATCKFTLLPCPNKCKGRNKRVKHFMRKDLDTHLRHHCPNRGYSCQHCGQKGTYANMLKHDKMCEKKEVTCRTPGCSEKMQRRLVSRHIMTNCEHAIISCKYVLVGCETKLKRKDMAAHEDDKEGHLNLALDTVNTLRKERHQGEPIKLKLTDYQKKKENAERVRSPSYYTSPNGYHMAIEVDVHGHANGKGTHVSVFAPVLKGNYDAQLKWPLIGKVTFTLLNQLADKDHHQHTLELRAGHNAQADGPAWGKAQFIPHSALDYDAVNNTQYLKDDTLYFRMLVEPADHKPWLQ